MIGLKEKYNKEAMPAMREKFGYKSNMAVPSIKKVVVNTGFGRLISGKSGKDSEKIYSEILDALVLIVGQKPVLTNSKKSIAGFKLRDGIPVGAKITLRGQKMYDLLERLIFIVLPRTRDFAGLEPTAIDKEGNLTIGIKEHIIFPEIHPEKVRKIFGLEITVVNDAKTKEEGLELFRLLGFPIKKNG
ncbi:MAG: 50S ribosomal protein L5 [Patescibacteria group bacterium]|nr:50S ribosomal protein L5 [Patescibacteria group bacterium]